MFKKILIANRGEIARGVIRSARKMGIATVAALAALGAPPAGAAQTARRVVADPAPSARFVAAAFRDICLRTRFDRGPAQAELEKLGWVRAGSGRTDSGKGYAFTHWEFPLGWVQIGYSTIGGVDLEVFNCSLVIKGAAAPPRAEIEAALEAVLAPARFRDARTPPADFARVAAIVDRDDEQEFVGLWGNNVPLRAPGTMVLGPGVAIDYGHAKGPYAKKLTGR